MITIGVSHLYRNTEFHDATVLLSSDHLLLEQKRVELQTQRDTLLYKQNTCKRDSVKCKAAAAPSPSQLNPAVAIESTSLQPATAFSKLFHKLRRGISSKRPLANAERPAATSAANEGTGHGQLLTIPVHQTILSPQSDFFKTATLTSISGDSANGNSLAHPLHPIIVMCEVDVEAALSLLKFMYTHTVDIVDCTAPRLMQMILVSSRKT